MQFFNQNSFVLVSVFITSLAAFFLFRRGMTLQEWITLGAMILGLVLAYIVFNPGQSAVADPQQATKEIGAGKPVLLEMQSPY